MARTPGLIVPSAYSSKEELERDLRRRSAAAGFTPFEASAFAEDVVEHHDVQGQQGGLQMAYSDKPATPGELVHFGVKGMHWGVRKDKKPALAPHSGATSRQHAHNRAAFGKRGSRRINEKLHEGKDLKTARLETRAELKTRRRKQVALALGAYIAVRAVPMILGSANVKMSNIAANKMASNGAKAAQNLFADRKGIPNYSTINVAFDSATGIWG